MMDQTDMHLLLHSVYEDDITNAADVPKNGRTYEQAELDTEQTLNALANSIVPEIITVESDRPGKHSNNQVAILDLEVGPTPSGKIQHQHYRKPMANPGVVWSRSGLSSDVKRTILFREGLRRLSNCSPELAWSIKAAWLSDLNFYMRLAGHTFSYRLSITKRVIAAYNAAVQTGQLYRDRQSRRSDKNASGGQMWLKKFGYDVTASVPVTVDNKLTDTLKQVSARTRWKVKYVDLCGPTVLKTLMRANHNPPSTCSKPRCLMCLEGPSNMRCHAQNISYRMVCNRTPCSDNLDMKKLKTAQLLRQIEQKGAKPSLYEGQSFRGPYTRGKQHNSLYTGVNKDKSWMWHHTRDDHGGEVGDNRGLSDYKFVPLRTHRDNLGRQTFEGYRQTIMENLQYQNKVKCQNSKLDFVQPLMSNINVTKGNRNFRPGHVSNLDNNAMPNSYNTQDSSQQFFQAQTDSRSQTDSQESQTESQTNISESQTEKSQTDKKESQTDKNESQTEEESQTGTRTHESLTETQTEGSQTESQTEKLDKQLCNIWTQTSTPEPDKTYAEYHQESMNISESMTNYSSSQTLKNQMKIYISQKRKRLIQSDLGPAQHDKLRPVKQSKQWRQDDSAD